MPISPLEPQILAELEASLTAELENARLEAMQAAEEILARTFTVHQFHAVIGHWNNDLVDAVRVQFSDPQDFFARWLHGLMVELQSEISRQQIKYGYVKNDKAIFRLGRLMQNVTVRSYTHVFLVRNFYRNLISRTRAKPHDHLWSIWFGNNQMRWGLLIAPVFRKGAWTNDKSEIRRARYDYWTIGHILTTGIVDPDTDEIMYFDSAESLAQFYASVLRRLSSSQYERAFSRMYADYLRESDDVESEPFLIPELRYAGVEDQHDYRLDFAILNPHVMSFIGFELSPHSTHLAVRGIRSTTQQAINSRLALQWNEEMNKRNQYFTRYGITTITFTDSQLGDIEGCFNTVRHHLAARPAEPIVLDQEIQGIEQFVIPFSIR